MINSVYGIDETNCCGCGACYQTCPVDSIVMRENKRGFLVPEVNINTCINCGKCKQVCPEIKQPSFRKVKSVYAAICKDESIINSSTSGGIFTVIAEQIISEGGVVYGCSWNDQIEARHVRIDDIKDVKVLQKSKYVQSNINETFINVKDDLNKGYKILFSGTPCQIAGLRKFIGNERESLITVEVACHGVPSPGLFRKYIKWRANNVKSRIIDVQFRNKDKHNKGEHYKLSIAYKNGHKKYYFYAFDPYYGAFLEGRTLRESCYKCKFKGKSRVSDILLCDYWGIEREHKKFPAKKGASAIFILSKKGESLFKSVENKLIMEKSTIKKVIEHNDSIISSTNCTEDDKLKSIEVDSEYLFQSIKPHIKLKTLAKYLIPESLKYALKRI